MKILITGAAGFIGSHLLEELVKQKHDVIGVDNYDEFLYPADYKRKNLQEVEQNVGKKVEIIPFDINSSKIVDLLKSENPDVIVHLAARAGVRASLKDPLSYSEFNIRGTINLLEAARQAGVEHFVFGSSSSVYGKTDRIPFVEDDYADKPLSVYAASKRSGELMCYAYHNIYGLSVNCLRFFTVYGPRQRPDMAIHKFTRMIESGEQITIFGDGTSKRDYTYCKDIVQGIIGAINYRRGFEVFNLGNSQVVELNYLISLIEKETGKKAITKRVPWPKTDPLVTSADITKAKKMLGYSPKTNIEEGIRNFVEWYKMRRV